MEEKVMKLAELKKAEKNVRMHTIPQIEQFKRSVHQFGQIRPIVIDENNSILAGNGLYETMLQMGIKEAKVWKITNLTENQKKKLMIADNKIFNLGVDNLEVLTSFIEDLKDDLDIPGYDDEVLRSLVADAEETTDRLSEYGKIPESAIEEIKDKQEVKENLIDKAMSTPNPVAGSKETNDITPTRQFVICPKCGEKIWL